VAALEHPDPERILILGGGAAGLIGEAIRQRPLVLDGVELDSVLQAMLVGHLPADLRAPLSAPGVRQFAADPRRFVATTRDRYDLVLLGMPEPSSGQANRYYTREFFAECAAALDPAGVLALRLPAAENLWAPALTRRMASIDAALREVFPHALWLPGTTSVVLASRAPLTRDADTLAARLARRGLRGRLVTPAYLRYLVTNDRVAEIAARLAAARVPANRDARPVCYQYTLVLWLARFYPAVAWAAAPRLPAGAGWWLAAAGALLAGLVRLGTRGPRRSALRRALVVGLAGGIGMVAESLLLLAYQARHGVLYQDLGVLLMAYMAGLAVGAATADWLRRRPRVVGAVSPRVLLAVLAGLATGLGLALAVGADLGLPSAGYWLFAFGALTAAVFARLSAEAADQAAAAGPLYGADLAGGCAGALAAGLLLIPLAGFVGTAVALGAAALLALVWV
jgi:spermidine synthase